MDDRFLRAVLSRVFHDLMSPMSAVSLAVESIESSIQDQTCSYINSGLEDFKNRVSVFRIFTIDNEDKIGKEQVLAPLKSEAEHSNIQLSLSNFPDPSSGKILKMAAHLFILSKKIAVKDGSIKIGLFNDRMQSDVSSKRCIDLTRAILDASRDIEMKELNSRNIDEYWAINHASASFDSKVDILPSHDGWSLIVPF